MKTISKISIALIALAVTSCAPKVINPTIEDQSWTVFCNTRGYDVCCTSEKVINEYLDTWCGSAEEEVALEANGIEL